MSIRLPSDLATENEIRRVEEKNGRAKEKRSRPSFSPFCVGENLGKLLSYFIHRATMFFNSLSYRYRIEGCYGGSGFGAQKATLFTLLVIG